METVGTREIIALTYINGDREPVRFTPKADITEW
jgi:hypothetical protein